MRCTCVYTPIKSPPKIRKKPLPISAQAILLRFLSKPNLWKVILCLEKLQLVSSQLEGYTLKKNK